MTTDMRKLILTALLTAGVGLSATAQNAYKILSECDTTVKAKIEKITLGSRDVRHFVYEYPSKDGDGQPVTISGIVMVPADIANGTTPCDGIILFNHHTIGGPEQAPSQGELDVPSGILANPLKPNYIIVMSDYIGYGSSIDHQIAYLCGDTNARNCLDGLLAARQLLDDKQIPQGRFLFNMGYSQGGTESMYIAKLRDMEYKDRGITFDKTFSGGGMLDCEEAYSAYVEKDQCDAINDVAMFLISVNENCHLGIDYHDLFKEPLASHVQEVIETKSKSVFSRIGVSDLDSLHQLLQPAYMDRNSDAAKKLRAKLEEIKITNGWEPDTTQRYFIEHSRHDNYVPIKCGRAIIPWMKSKGFTPSLVPGKTNLQTNTVVFKLKHQPSAAVWFVQTMAAVQAWPVIYYEGEQNRYYHDVVKDLNLMKVVKFLESLGIDLRKMFNTSQARAFVTAPRRASFFDLLQQIQDALAKVDLTIYDVIEMINDSGITGDDIMEVYDYIKGTDAPAPSETVMLGEHVEVPVYLLRQYEQTLADWLMLGGVDVQYDQWGW
jgi:hypothetical protein